MHVPKYREHPNGQAFVEHKSIPTPSHRLYLGKYGTPESRRRYAQFVARLESSAGKVIEGVSGRQDATIAELAAAYLEHCESYYRLPNGAATTEMAIIVESVKPLCRLYGEDLAADFGPRRLKQVRQHMEKSGLARTTVNKYLSRIKRLFRWASSEELVPSHLYHGLLSVGGLQAGRTTAPESGEVSSVSWPTVEATLSHLSPIVASMVRVQYYCGMRPQEVCAMRACDLDRSGPAWLYVPPWHKNAWRGATLVKAVPRIAQALLVPLMEGRAEDAAIFCPQDAPGARLRSGVAYTHHSYRRAIHRACDRAFPPPPDCPEDEVAAWKSSRRWSPNQLRHGIATLIGERLGEAAAQKWLGHASLDTTAIYLDQQVKELRELADRLDQLFQSERAAS